MNAISQLRSFLSQFFNSEHYRVAIEAARARVASDPKVADQWTLIVELIKSRAFQDGEPLALVSIAANQMLDENTDDEAYVWLDLMVQNIEHPDREIEEY